MAEDEKKITLGRSGANDAERSLGRVAIDLWGGEPASVQPTPPDTSYQSTFPPFEQLWKVADETVDWTDALVKPRCDDGLTSQRLWQFFHENAQAVLSGDLAAYLRVLQTANPLGDLRPYASRIEASADSADRLSACYEVHPAYIGGGAANQRRYLSGMALRIARDLMALLPVTEVAVLAKQADTVLLSVTFTRAQMQKVRFRFIDPVAFVRECGGAFEGAEPQHGDEVPD